MKIEKIEEQDGLENFEIEDTFKNKI